MIIKGFFHPYMFCHLYPFLWQHILQMGMHMYEDIFPWGFVLKRNVSSYLPICKFFSTSSQWSSGISVSIRFWFIPPHLTLFYCLSLLLCLWSFNHDSLKDSWTRVHFRHFFFFVLDYFCWSNCIVARWVNAFVPQKIKEPKWYRRKDWKLDTNEFIIEWKYDKQEAKIRPDLKKTSFEWLHQKKSSMSPSLEKHSDSFFHYCTLYFLFVFFPLSMVDMKY